MRFHRSIVLATLIAAGTAFAGDEPSRAPGVMLVFEGGTGVQPFRSQAGAPVLNVVAGVNPGGAPWGLTSFFAIVKNTGAIRARGTGVLLLGADGIGTRAGPRQVMLSLFCRNAFTPPAVSGTLQTTPFNSPPVDLDVDGNFEVRGMLTDANGATPPLDCGNALDNRPVLLIRAVTAATATTPATPGAWFAAGFIADKRFDGK